MTYLIEIGTILIGILFAALPFVILGVIASNVIQLFVSRERLVSLYGTGFWRNYSVSVLLGFLLPLCECGIVPVARALSKRGVPTSGIVMFLLSAPVWNPVTMAATYAAFSGRPMVWISRLLMAQVLAIVLGWIFSTFRDRSGASHPLLRQEGTIFACADDHAEGSVMRRLLTSCHHELMDILPFVTLGAAFTAVLQVTIPKQAFLALADRPFLAIAAFMAFALVLSVCSSVDAFVILPFVSRVPFAAILAFLAFGPLIDVKNILLFRAYFSTRFVGWYFGLVTILTFSLSVLAWLLYPIRLSV